MVITRLHAGENRRIDPEHEAWLRRQAVQLAAQLPEKPQDALEIIRHMETVVRTILCPTPA
jgi:hypothetical protein